MDYEDNTEEDVLGYTQEYQPYHENNDNKNNSIACLFSHNNSIQEHDRRHYYNKNQQHVYSNLQETTESQKINEEYDDNDDDDDDVHHDDITELLKLGDDPVNNGAIALHVRNIMSELEIAAEEDVYRNRRSPSGVNKPPDTYKLKKLPLLNRVLSTKQLESKLLDHGVLNVLAKWLQPLPDGRLPDVKIRAGVLNNLTEFPIDLDVYGTRKQLNISGLGTVIMWLLLSDEETDSNRKLAMDLVSKWASMGIPM